MGEVHEALELTLEDGGSGQHLTASLDLIRALGEHELSEAAIAEFGQAGAKSERAN